jgi:hypothetical protein
VVPRPPAPPAKPTIVRELEDASVLRGNKEFAALKSTVRQAADDPHVSGSVRPSLQSAHEQLRSLDRLASLMRSAAILAHKETAYLPPSLRTKVLGLHSLEGLETEFRSPWETAPQVEDLGHKLIEVQAATKDREFTARLREALADKAVQKGYPETAQKLRDLKLLATHEASDERVLLDSAPGPAILSPEASPQGTRPAIKESVSAVLPPWEEMENEMKARKAHLRDEVRKEFEQEFSFRWRVSHAHLHTIMHSLSQEDKETRDQRTETKEERERQDKQAIASVEHLLGRPLEPSERLLVARMRTQGKKVEEIAKILRGLQPVARQP